MILFLDFDGTLHPLWREVSGARERVVQAYGGPWLTEMVSLAEILEPYAGKMEIVIASLWAKRLPISELRALFPSQLQGIVRDAVWTPHDPGPTGVETKFEAIQSWLRRSGCGSEWLALDDDARDWPLEFRHRLVHAVGTLANVEVRVELARRLTDVIRD